MFKNLFKSTNVKKMEDQIAQLREDVTSLQAQLNELINKNQIAKEPSDNVLDEKLILDKDNVLISTLDNVLISTLDNVLEPKIKEELVAVVIDPASILENPTTHGLESLIMKEPFELLDTIMEKVLDQVSTKVENVAEKVLEQVPTVEKVLDQVPTVEKETNTLPPKKRRQSKKATHAEVHCLEPCI